MRNNNDLLEVLESLEKKIELVEHNFDNLDLIYNSTFSGPSFIWHTCICTTIAMFLKNSFNIMDEDMRKEHGTILRINLDGIFESTRYQYVILPFIIIFFCLFMLAYIGKSTHTDGKVDGKDLKELKKYLEIIDLKDYDIKHILLKNIRELKHILEQRDISEEERQIILEFLEEMHKWV